MKCGRISWLLASPRPPSVSRPVAEATECPSPERSGQGIHDSILHSENVYVGPQKASMSTICLMEVPDTHSPEELVEAYWRYFQLFNSADRSERLRADEFAWASDYV